MDDYKEKEYRYRGGFLKRRSHAGFRGGQLTQESIFIPPESTFIDARVNFYSICVN